MADARVLLINSFEVSCGDEERFTAAWTSARDFFARQPGFVDTVLHRAIAFDESVEPGAEFRFVGVTRWETVRHSRDATRRSRDVESLACLDAYTSHPGMYRVADACERVTGTA